MKLNYIVLILILVNLTIALGNSIHLNLDQSDYLPRTALQGSIVLNLTNTLDLGYDPKIVLSIGSMKEEADIIQILSDLDQELDIKESTITASTSESQKTLTSSNSQFGFKVVKESEIQDIDFNIEGINNDGFPESPSISFLDIVLWNYAGEFISWGTQVIRPEGLTENSQSSETIVDTNENLYCETLELPFSNKFNISVKVTTEDNNGDISLKIFGFDQEELIANENKGECKLKNEPGEAYLNCLINTTSYIKGDHLVCFYNEINDGKYTLTLDNEGNYYSCPSDLLDSDTTECTLTEDGDIYIKSFKPVFEGALNKKVKFSNFSSEDDVKEELNSYLTECLEDAKHECILPFYYESENEEGKLKLSSLVLEYTKPTNERKVTRQFFDIEEVSAEIAGLKDDSEFDNYLVEIPLAVFQNITLPNTTAKNKIVKVMLNNLYSQDKINITLSPTAQLSSNINNSELNSLRNDPKIKEFLSIMDIDVDAIASSLSSYDLELNALDQDTSLTLNEKNTRKQEINPQKSLLLNKIPKSVVIKEDVEYPRVYPDKIDAQFLGDKKEDELLAVQDNVNIETEIRLFGLIDQLGNYKDYTLIKRTLTSDTNKYSIIEEIPKSIVNNLSGVMFNTQNYAIIKDDPIVKWDFIGDSEIMYIISGNQLTKLNKIVTTVLAEKQEGTIEETEESVCGDEVCTEILEDEISCPQDCKPKFEINWPIAIVLIVILVIGVIYFNFFMGKRKIKDIIKKKPLFTSVTDEINLRNYLIKSLQNKVPKENIYKILLSKKWTKEQVDYIFKSIQQKK